MPSSELGTCYPPSWALEAWVLGSLPKLTPLLCSPLYSFIPTLLSTPFPSYQLPKTQVMCRVLFVCDLTEPPHQCRDASAIIIPTLQMECTEAIEIK